MNINHIIRGEDLIYEHMAYVSYCINMGFELPKFSYLSRLEYNNVIIAGSNNLCPIYSLREKGYCANEIMDSIKKACLINPDNGITIENLNWSRPQFKIGE